MNNLFVRFIAVLILGVSWVVSLQQVLYAGHLPGDSFTGAVFLLIPLMLQFVVLGREQGMRKIPVRFFFRAMLTGLAVLILVAVVPALSGKKMFESSKWEILGRRLSSTMLFEAAVFLLIVGVVAYALVTFKEPD